jgi:aspartate carbamoyltransferase catalytic subunit
MLQFLKKPLINAGDGSGEHPTQAIQDAFTIWNQFKYLDGLNITLMGDLKHGRTVHSLVQVLNNFQNITLNTVAPLGFEFPSQYFRKH